MPKTPPPAQDLIDRLQEDWSRERPELATGAMGVVGRVIHLGHRFEADATRVLAPFGLHYTDLDVLATLRRSGRPYRLSPSQLQASVLLTSGAMTACLGRLERAGLIARAPSEHDRRSIHAELTPAGRALVDKALPLRFAEADRRVAGLNQAERKELARLLRKLTLATDAD